MDEATSALKDYVKQGGTLWADGITAWKNERGRLSHHSGRLTDLLASRLSKSIRYNRAILIPSHRKTNSAANSGNCPLAVKGAEVLLRDPTATRLP